MASQVLADLTTEVNETIGIMQSAEVALNGVSSKIAAAVSAALANGATAEELKPVSDLGLALRNEAANLAAAVAANP